MIVPPTTTEPIDARAVFQFAMRGRRADIKFQGDVTGA